MATLSAKEAARELGTDARTLRKFMRAITPKEDQPGQGNRYQIEARSIGKLKKQFAEWNKPKQRKVESNGDEAEVIEAEDELEVFEEDDTPDFSDTDESDAEPTDEELEDIDEEFDLEEL